MVGLSGGSDSLALLHVTAAWARRVGRKVLAVSVDHQLQAASATWTRTALDSARAAGAETLGLAWTGDKPATGLPAAARAARHRLLAEAAREAGAGVILLGHTGDDVLENALMRQAGSNLGTLAEWSPSPVWPEGRGLFHFRPLLALRRAELRAGLTAAGLTWLEDPANQDLRYARPRARAALAAGRSAPPDPSVREPPCGALAVPTAAGFALAKAALVAAPRSGAVRVLAAAIACASGQQAPPRRDGVEALYDRIAGPGPFTATLAGARVEAGEAVLVMREAGERARGGLRPLPLPAGRAVVWDGRYEVVAYRDGLTMQPLGGLAGRLGDGEQRMLKTLPGAARGALPAIVHPDGAVTSPVLAGAGGVRCRPLWGDRLLGACGAVAREA